MGYTKGYKKEKLDRTPVSVPFGCKKPESLHDTINRLIANRFASLQLDDETETFEEADDFDVDDDFDPSSPWEEIFDKSGNSLGFLDQNNYQMLQKETHEKKRYSDDDNKRSSGNSEANLENSEQRIEKS